MHVIRYLSLCLIILSFAFLLSFQRMESKAYELKIGNIEKHMALIDTRKQEVQYLISFEIDRINRNNEYALTKNISLNDIILVSNNLNSDIEKPEKHPYMQESVLESWLSFLAKKSNFNFKNK